MKVLIACEESQAVCLEFRKKGHLAFSCDILPCSGGRPEWHIQDNIKNHLQDSWDMVIAFPPCTHLSSSGAGSFAQKRKDGRQKEGIDFFMLFVNAGHSRIAIENPVGIMSTLYRKPDQIIQPWQYGHPETKATCLWLKGLPVLHASNIVEPDFMRKKDGSFYRDAKGKRYSRIHFMSGSNKDRARLRSKTYPGVAAAMADQWG